MDKSLFEKLEIASAAVGLTPRPAFSYDDSMIKLDRSEFNKRMEVMEQVIRQDEREKCAMICYKLTEDDNPYGHNECDGAMACYQSIMVIEDK